APQNVVIGGAAGAVPPLVGWAAATGDVTVPALLLFAIVFVWTPPHFWALALLIKDNYKAAGVPMLPVVRGERETARQIVLYSAGLVGATLLPFAWGSAGSRCSPPSGWAPPCSPDQPSARSRARSGCRTRSARRTSSCTTRATRSRRPRSPRRRPATWPRSPSAPTPRSSRTGTRRRSP